MTSQSASSVASAQPTDRIHPSDPGESGTQFLSLPELRESSGEKAAPALTSNPLLNVKTRLQVCVGETVLTVDQLLKAKLHQVLTLDRGVDDVVDVLLEGKVIARGQLVAVGDNFGVRLTELPVSLRP